MKKTIVEHMGMVIFTIIASMFMALVFTPPIVAIPIIILEVLGYSLIWEIASSTFIFTYVVSFILVYKIISKEDPPLYGHGPGEWLNDIDPCLRVPPTDDDYFDDDTHYEKWCDVCDMGDKWWEEDHTNIDEVKRVIEMETLDGDIDEILGIIAAIKHYEEHIDDEEI